MVTKYDFLRCDKKNNRKQLFASVIDTEDKRVDSVIDTGRNCHGFMTYFIDISAEGTNFGFLL
jgi:hypothetical protein